MLVWQPIKFSYGCIALLIKKGIQGKQKFGDEITGMCASKYFYKMSKNFSRNVFKQLQIDRKLKFWISYTNILFSDICSSCGSSKHSTD